MKPPRVHFICSSDANGASPHGFMPALSLAGAGFDVECICLGAAATTRVEFAGEQLATVTVQRPRGWWGGVVLQWRLLLAMLRRRFASGDCLFFLSSSAVTPAALLALAGVDPRRIIYHTQDFLEPGRHRGWSFCERLLSRRASRVVCNEANRARCLASIYQLKSLPDILPTYLPASWPRPACDDTLRSELLRRAGTNDPDSARLIMHAGKFSAERCGYELLQAMQRLPDPYILVIGTASSGEELPPSLVRLRERGRVVLLPHLSFPDLLRHCACCDVGLLLYPNDGLGNFFQAPGRLTEYLGCGLPLVASNFPGLEALIRGHQLGLVCDPAVPDDIARAIREVSDQPAAFRATERARLRALARTEFAYENSAPLLHRLVADALAPAAPPLLPRSPALPFLLRD